MDRAVFQWGRRAHRLEEQLSEVLPFKSAAVVFEQSLAAQMPDHSLDRAMEDLRRALQGRAAMQADYVRDLPAHLGISERTLRRRCHQLFGYGPKTFLRILRFQRFIAFVQRANHPSLAALASQCGYADQAHLSREVRALSGLTPRVIASQLARLPAL